jgi:molybdenum-dependent DNA-binding transcriptional regulator ModE
VISQSVNKDIVQKAIADTGSVSKAAKKIGVATTTLTLWLARNGYEVQKTARLVEIRYELTGHGRAAVAAMVSEGETGQEQEKE